MIEAEGAILCPGLVDMRAALGEPGFEYRETIASAAAAAAAGGITTLAALPDTQPAIDDPALVQLLRTRGEETGSLTILPYGAVTRGCRGEELAELGSAARSRRGCLYRWLPSHRTRQVDAAGVVLCARVRRPHRAASGGPLLGAGGAATESEQATRLGLPGIPAAAEAIMVARDIRLAELTGGAVHFAHVSTGEALALIRAGQGRPACAVTCDTAPPYFDLNETSIGEFRTYAKLSPPLRKEHDRKAVIAALADGTIDAIASDHQPRDADDKRLPFALASAGGAGLATLLAVTLAHVHNGSLALPAAIDLLTVRPAALLGTATRAGSPRVRRPTCACSIPTASGRSRPADCPARRRIRRSTAEHWKASCWGPGSAATAGIRLDCAFSRRKDRA